MRLQSFSNSNFKKVMINNLNNRKLNTQCSQSIHNYTVNLYVNGRYINY